jgi:hypothetical protein
VNSFQRQEASLLSRRLARRSVKVCDMRIISRRLTACCRKIFTDTGCVFTRTSVL